ncbi:MAG: deoxyguanosinetriphosphate triphosphohydrolase [Candidatus Tectomicrobia bacterium]|nr:deoxyguanosinetriphosphate triphosphohydrolase [Candidatus Tectomicrobia bacterium]
MLTREEMEAWEAKSLAPYAVRSGGSRGRRHPEPEHPFRTAFQRDRDRIIHSRAFRRLEYKTQVFVYHEGDHYRTRLTHTLEAVSMARVIARALRLNEDLAEAIALAHDLGHPPFGHSGEAVLNRLMRDHGGFEHNLQGLRVVDLLEDRYPEFPGLNLTWETREGILKHNTDYDSPRWRDLYAELEPDLAPSLEARIADLADEIAYNNHDIDDGLTSGLLRPEDLEEVDLWREHFLRVRERFPGASLRVVKHQTIRAIINHLVTDVIESAAKRLCALGVHTLEDVRACKEPLVSYSPETREKNQQLKEFLFRRMYRNYRVIRMEDKTNRILTDLFQAYLNRQEQLPPRIYEKCKADLPERVICDYVAGMTDRFAQDEHRKLFDPHARV